MIFLSNLTYEEYDKILYPQAIYNINKYIIGETIIVPSIKEKFNYNDDIIDMDINQLSIPVPSTIPGTTIIPPTQQSTE